MITMPQQRIAIVAAADEAYSMPLAVMLSSALFRLSKDIVPELHVLDAGLGARSLERLVRLSRTWHGKSELHLHDAKNVFSRIKTGRYPPSSLVRLVIPKVLPDNLERALYLDSDIVVERDVSQLWDIPLAGLPLHAVEDIAFSSSPEFRAEVEALWSKFRIDQNTGYFNSGVLLLNMPLWRREAIAERVLDLLRDQLRGTEFPDQDAMNVVLAGRWGSLDPVWNFQAVAMQKSVEEHRKTGGRADGEGKVLHYTSNKPWSRTCHKFYFTNFLRAYARSGWDPTPLSSTRRLTFVGQRVRSALVNRARRVTNRA